MDKEELLMLTHGQYKPSLYPATVHAEEGLILHIDEDAHHPEDGHCAYLVLDGAIWMTTHRGEHFDMRNAVDQCPRNARVFIAGLGLGLILLYLARSLKCRETLVVEIDRRVIRTVEPPLQSWFSSRYPEFEWSLIRGDAEEEISRNGFFDWIFWDIWATATFSEGASERHEELSRPYLNEGGAVTTWHDLARLRKEMKYA